MYTLLLVTILLLHRNSLSLEFGECFVQSLSKNVHFFFLHTNGSSCSEVRSGVGVTMSSPAAKGVGSNGFLYTRCHHSTQRNMHGAVIKLWPRFL